MLFSFLHWQHLTCLQKKPTGKNNFAKTKKKFEANFDFAKDGFDRQK